jgi:RimJ/RimL family protein N-acetyltransferase
MRPLTLADAETVAGWLRDIDDLALYDRSMPVPPSPERLREAWKDDLIGGRAAQACWFAVDNGDGTPVAIGGLQAISYTHGDAVMPIFVARQARGGGIGLGIGVALLDLACDRLRLHRVTTFFRADNERSAHLTQRLGFREEGRMRQAWFAGGQHLDCVMVGVLRDEWYAARDALKAATGPPRVSLSMQAAGRSATG